MKIIYKDKEAEAICTKTNKASSIFGGNKNMVEKLMSRINALQNAETLKDIIVQKQFRFHALKGKREGQFAIDVKTKKERWRIVLIPLNENEQKYNPCKIDEISSVVKTIEITEVSDHYE